jgi:hypothetical protein
MSGRGGINLGGVTREQKMLGAAAANILFIIMMFFDWFGADASAGGFSVSFGASGTDVVPSWWILAIIAAVAAAVLAAEALYIELPLRTDAVTGAWLSFIPFIFTVMIILEGPGGASRKIGIFLALIFSALAFALALIASREEA